MVNLELECLVVRQRIDDLRSRAERRRLLRAARTPHAERRTAEVVRIPRAPGLRRGQA